MQLPGGFEGGKLSGSDFNYILKSVSRLGTDYAKYADILKDYQSLYVLWAYDSNVQPGGFLTNVAVANVPIMSALKLKTVANQMIAAFPKEFEVVSQEEFKALTYIEARKLIVNATLFNQQIKEVIYLLRDKDTVWVVLFATSQKDLKTRMTDFDQSARTVAAVR